MAHEFRYRRRVQFADTDLAGIVHFARFLAFVEEAEHAFLRSLGLGVHLPGEGHAIGFPRMAVRIEYRSPLRFEDEPEVHIWLHRKGRRSLTYQFRVSLDGAVAAQGQIAVACCKTFADGSMEATALPPAFDGALDEAPYEPLSFR